MLKKVAPCFTICCAVTALGLFIFSFFAANMINKALFKTAAQNVVLKPSTYDKWGSVPGSTGTFVAKNYSFFNFTNNQDFLYFNGTAKLVETPSFNYQEYMNLLDPTYTNDSAGNALEVSFYYQRYNLPLNTTDDTKKRTIINLGPLGVWNTAKNLPYEVLGMSAFSVLQAGFVKNLYPSVLAKGVFGSNIKDKDTCYTQILDKVSPPLTITQKEAIWSDPLYGMGSGDTLAVWILATQGGYLSGAANLLKDYFLISTAQISIILNNPMKGWINTLDSFIANWFRCPTTPCDPKFLGALQWTQQGVTMNPPKPSNSSTTNPFPSIATVNRTASGFPEISYYLTEYLLKNDFKGNKSNYENLTFPIEFGEKVMNGTITPPYTFPAAPETLLNIKNYAYVLSEGKMFEEDGGNADDPRGLENIQNQWGLPSLQHAYVFYNWCKYFVREFALKESLNGRRTFLALGKFSSQVIYQTFDGMKSFLFADFVARDILHSINKDNISCNTLLKNSFSVTDDALVNEVCSIPQLSSFDANSIRFLVSVCRYDQQYSYQVLLNSTKLKKSDIGALCTNTDQQTFASYSQASELMLNQHYGCSNVSKSCTDFEFAAIQWGSSNITENLPDSLQASFGVTKATSVSELYPQVFKQRIEYYAIATYLKPNYPNANIQKLNYNTILQYLNSLSLFSPSMIQRAFLLNENKDYDNFTKNFGEMDPTALLSYFRFLIIEHAFDGLTQTRTGHELLYGYTDKLVDKIRNMYVPDGGNPSVNPVIFLGGQNSSAEEARKYYQVTLYTGYDDPNKVKVYKSAQNKTFITYNCSTFDGMDVKVDAVSPWKNEVPIKGSDSTLNPPNITDGKDFTIFVSDVFFVGHRVLRDLENNTKTIHDIKTYKLGLDTNMLANKTNNPNNEVYYSDKYNMALNLTKAKNLPIFVTKQFFLDVDQEMVDAVELYSDESMKQRILPSKEFDMGIYIEPTTGAAIAADQRLQLNVLFEPDDLFVHVKTSFVPIMYFYRGFQFSNETLDKVFGPLKTGFMIRDHIFLVLLITSIVLIVLTLFCGRVWRQNVAQRKIEAEEYTGSNEPGALLLDGNRAKADDSVTMI